jgi:5'-3' exoribonuclease 1
MGIKRFYAWVTRHFKTNMTPLERGDKCPEFGIHIDNLMLDLNGLFHEAAQIVYEYGNHKKPPRLLGGGKKRKANGLRQQLKVFELTCEKIESIIEMARPTKRVIICIDGPAPRAKRAQQRQRRFRSAAESSTSDCSFDSNVLTAGTKFMEYLSKYVDWYIRKRISESVRWQELEIVYSSDRVPGEGEHKVVNFMRYYGEPSETYCIHGMDADLIMLALGTHLPNFYILREDQRGTTTHCINIGQMRERLADMMEWKSDEFKFSRKAVIDDFIFLCFMVGNDFLPHIPSLEIIEDGIEVILEVYSHVAPVHGHITRSPHGKVVFNKRALQAYLYTIGGYEKDILEGKLRRKNSYFPDKTLEKCARMCNTDNGESRFQLDIDRFRNEHFKESFPEGTTAEQVSHDYLEGLQWVLSYYTRGVPNWEWCYPYHYAPSASIIAENVPSFRFPMYGRTIPPPPFQQLLSVLPPKSAGLIPEPLCTLLTDQSSPLKAYCPDDIKLDKAGMRQDWEAIVLLPMIDTDVMKEAYFSLINDVDERELKRNVTGKSFFYTYTPDKLSHFKSFYGDIENCAVRATPIDL